LLAEAVFKEINEAFEVLSDIKKKQRYDYERSFAAGNVYDAVLTNVESILNDCKALEKIFTSLNAAYINRDALYFHIQTILSDNHITILQKENNCNANNNIITILLACAKPLWWPQARHIVARMKTFACSESIEKIDLFLLQQQKEYQWSRYKIILVIVVVALLCMIIFFSVK
jgi:hypothetical protein